MYSHAAGSIGVVDVAYILSKSQAAQNIQAQRQSIREAFLADISKTEQALRAEEKEILDQSGKIPQEDYLKLRQAYEANLLELRKDAQQKKRALEEASNVAMNVLREELYVVVQEIANERGFELVISNKNVIAGEKSLDITKETLEIINKNLKEVPLKIEEVE
ncbi:MAG: OmpH family outer membrane protein [Rhodospirillales bacterium]|nr:OmpH family outer membrane protein [Rhodospirillales bacterium]